MEKILEKGFLGISILLTKPFLFTIFQYIPKQKLILKEKFCLFFGTYKENITCPHKTKKS